MSNSLTEADATWRGEHPDTARLVAGDVVAAVQALKNESGDELQIWGSGKLLQTLLGHELVDRFRLMTFPLVLGSGRRLFNDGILPATMRPAGLTVTDLGIVSGPVIAGLIVDQLGLGYAGGLWFTGLVLVISTVVFWIAVHKRRRPST